MRKLSPFDFIKIGATVVRSVRNIRREIKAAKDPASPGGTKVTPAEAVEAVVKGLLDATPVVYEAVSGEPLPEGLDLTEVLGK